MLQTVIALYCRHNNVVLALVHNPIVRVYLADHWANVLLISDFFLLEFKLGLLWLLWCNHLFLGMIEVGGHRLSIQGFSVRLLLRESYLV